jgi:hypothetical protein
MRFDTASATPKLTFKAVRPLEVEEMKAAEDKGQSSEAKTAIANNPATLDGAKLPPKAEPKAEAAEAEPTKRTKKAAPKDVSEILDDWAE